MNDLTVPTQGDILEQVIIKGDLAKLTPAERVHYYKAVCVSVGLNPLTTPFAYIQLNGKLTLYALRACTDQLRQIHGVSVEDVTATEREGVFIVTAKVRDRNGRTDVSKGAVTIKDLGGEALANALMKAETKAKRRATLSICGLGMLDETEVETVPSALPAHVNMDTGEVGPVIPDALLTAATDAALKGTEALNAWWTAQSKDTRKTIGAKGLADLKAIAKGADTPSKSAPVSIQDIESDIPWKDE